MALDKVIDSAQLDAGMKATADAIREKTGSTGPVVWDPTDGFKMAVRDIQTGDPEAEEMLLSVIEKTEKPLTKLPEGLRIIGPYSLRGHLGLSLTTLPDSVTTISVQAFSYCDGLTEISLPAALTTIGNQGFYNCKNLSRVTFNSTPSVISANVFDGCTKLQTINVPWAEGAVANAPWGATNATINYNYTGG